MAPPQRVVLYLGCYCSCAVRVRLCSDGLQCGIQPVGCNGKKFTLDEIPTTQMDAVFVYIYNIALGFCVHIFPASASAVQLSGNRQRRDMNRMEAQSLTVVCLIVNLLKVEFQVGMTVEPNHILVVLHQALEYSSLSVAEQITAGCNIRIVNTASVTAIAPRKNVLKYKAPFISVCLQRFIKPLQFSLQEYIVF